MGPSGFTSHPRGSVLRIFIALKNPKLFPAVIAVSLCNIVLQQ
jgi:hypothetical protein